MSDIGEFKGFRDRQSKNLTVHATDDLPKIDHLGGQQSELGVGNRRVEAHMLTSENSLPNDSLQSLILYLGDEINRTNSSIEQYSDGSAMLDALRLGLIEISGLDSKPDETTYFAVNLTPEGWQFYSTVRDSSIREGYKR